MLKVETQKQWAANTITFVGDDDVYLRLSNSHWYELDEGHFRWIEDSSKLEDAWVGRGGIPFEDIQTFGG